MTALTKILTGAAGVAVLVGAAAPAAAQYYPPYGGYPGGGYGGTGGGVIDILGQILGGRSYASNERYAVEQCVRAVEHRINTRGLDNDGGRYRGYGYGYGYNNQYRNYMGARVTSVTQVSRRSNGGLKVYGFATTGGQGGYGGGYGGYSGGYGGYGNPGYGYDQYGYGQYGYQAQADARFDCTIDRYGRITDIDAKRNYSGAYPYRRY